MLADWVLRVAALVATAVAAGAKYDPFADLDAYPELQSSLLRYRHHPHHRLRHRHHHAGWPLFHHLRGHRHHKMALTHHSAAPRLNWNPEGEEDVNPNVAEKVIETPMVLPGRHPSVEKALDGMRADLQDLKDTQRAAQQTRGELEGKVSEVTHHMNDAMSIKHAMQQKEGQIQKERNKLMNLEREAAHIEETHSSLVTSLHRVLEPKLQFARERLEKKEMSLEREKQAAKGWQEKQDQIHMRALALLKAKSEAHQSLEEAERAMVEAKKNEEIKRRRYESERQKTSEEVQSFRYAETRLKAEITHEKAAEEAALEAKESVKKLSNVLAVESMKVEDSMEVSKTRIRQRVQQSEATREQYQHELTDLQRQYREWQESQRQRAAEVVKKGQDTAIAAEAYANRQKQVLDSAQTKVVQDAEAKSDWAWESGFSNDAGFTDSIPSLSD